MCQSDNGSITESSALRQWSLAYMRALDRMKDPRAPMQLQSMFSTAGMLNVESRMIPVPLSPWPTGSIVFQQHLLMSFPT